MRPDREVRRATSSAPAVDRRVGVGPWAGRARRTSASCRSAGGKNGSPWVWSQCRWPSRIVPRNGLLGEEAGEPAQPGAGVEDERRGGTRRGRWRRTTCARRRGRTRPRAQGSSPAPRRSVTRTSAAGDSSRPRADGPATERARASRSRLLGGRPPPPCTRVTARRVDVRRPPSSAARSPNTAPGPSWPSSTPSTSTLEHTVEQQEESSPGLALRDEHVAAVELADPRAGGRPA